MGSVVEGWMVGVEVVILACLQSRSFSSEPRPHLDFENCGHRLIEDSDVNIIICTFGGCLERRCIGSLLDSYSLFLIGVLLGWRLRVELPVTKVEDGQDDEEAEHKGWGGSP
jgi:hypothetical protein